MYTKNDTEAGPTGASSKIGINIDPDVYANISQDEGNVKENFSEIDISKMSVSEIAVLLAQLDEEEAEIDAELAEIDKELAELKKPTVEEERKVQLSETEKRQKKRAAEAEAESKAELTKAKKNYDRVSAELDEANKIIADQERILAFFLSVVTHNYVTVAHCIPGITR